MLDRDGSRRSRAVDITCTIKLLNSFIGVRSYRASRRLLSRATEELTILELCRIDAFTGAC